VRNLPLHPVFEWVSEFAGPGRAVDSLPFSGGGPVADPPYLLKKSAGPAGGIQVPRL